MKVTLLNRYLGKKVHIDYMDKNSNCYEEGNLVDIDEKEETITVESSTGLTMLKSKGITKVYLKSGTDNSYYSTYSSIIEPGLRLRVKLFKDEMRKLEQETGKLVPIEKIKEGLGDKVSEEQLKEVIEWLSREGDIFEARRGYFQLV